MTDHVTITDRFCGPPNSGNGGYTCGRLAAFIAGPAEVTLRRPPPLNRRLRVERQDDGQVALRDGQTLVATGVAKTVDLAVPPAPSLTAARTASAPAAVFNRHPFPGCFVCGPGRAAADGLRIFAGSLEDRAAMATIWTPDASVGDGRGRVRPEIVWAALDCPGAWTTLREAVRPIVLGRLAAEVLQPVPIGAPCVVSAWQVAREGRKTIAGTALFSADGALYARARATWIDLQPAGVT